jgi:hypothetical protein
LQLLNKLPDILVLNSWLLVVVDVHFGKKKIFFSLWAVPDKIYIIQYTCDNESLTNLCDSQLGFASLYKFRARLLIMLVSHLYRKYLLFIIFPANFPSLYFFLQHISVSFFRFLLCNLVPK